MQPDVNPPKRLEQACEATQVARRLRDLPAELQPPFDWEEFQRRARERSRQGTYKVRRPPVAAAAAFVAIIAAAAYWSRSSPDTAPLAPQVAQTEPSRLAPPPPEAPEPDVALAAASEQWLSRLPPEPAIVRVDTHLAVTELEDQIAWLDEIITTERMEGHSPRVGSLQAERARLVNSLAQVRYVETLANEFP